MGLGGHLVRIFCASESLWKKVQTVRGLLNCVILFALHVESRRVRLLGVAPHPDDAWSAQQARNLCIHWQETNAGATHIIHDAVSRFTKQFDAILLEAGVQPIPLKPGSPNMNAYAERWV